MKQPMASYAYLMKGCTHHTSCFIYGYIVAISYYIHLKLNIRFDSLVAKQLRLLGAVHPDSLLQIHYWI